LRRTPAAVYVRIVIQLIVWQLKTEASLRVELNPEAELSAQIATAIRDSIVAGKLLVDARLPSEADLSEAFGVSRPTVREALKRLAAQNLIRTQRGATGGAFVNRVSFDEVQESLVTSSTLLLSMNAIDFETACEARYALERACVALAAERRLPDHLAAMRAEIARQATDDLLDTTFCASDVAFHRALIDAAGNPMQPLMNMITFRARSRQRIVALHIRIADAIEARDGGRADAALAELALYTTELGGEVRARRAAPKLREV
jgi:GntR family transcriptional regulator, transcriptional repressor for pyruvate dehydrogenase complex